MRSASSADRSAICVTFTLPHENAVELQNVACSYADRLRELGVLAVQVGSATAISLQPAAGSSCQSVAHGGARERRQQTLNATRTNIAQYLGADVSSFPSSVGGGSAAENDVQINAVRHENATAIASMSTGIAVDHSANMIAESSPHIVNLLQHDIVSSRSACLSSSVSMSSASDGRPRKRARRRAPAAAAEVSVPLSMYGTADYANSAYSFQQPPSCVDSSTCVPSVHNMPAKQFKIPESRRKKATSRKTAAAKSQQLSITGQAASDNLTNSFSVGFSECSKSSEVGMFHATAPYGMGDGFQMNGVNPYHRIPVMAAGWQTYTTCSVPSNGLYQSPPGTAQYPSEYGQPRFRFAGNVDNSQLTADAGRVMGAGNYHNVTPASSAVFVTDTNQMYVKQEQVPSVLLKQTLRWSSAAESQSESVPYGNNNVHGVYNVTRDRTEGLPMSRVSQWHFMASPSDAVPTSDNSKPCAGTVTSAGEKMMQLSISSDIDRIKSSAMPACGSLTTNCISSLSGGHFNMPPPVTGRRANGLFADVHSSVLAFHEHAAHAKMNGDVDCLQRTQGQALSRCETVFEKSAAVSVLPYAPLASSLPTCIGNANCVPGRQLQQPSLQLPIKVQQCGLQSFEDAGINGCSSSTVSDMPKFAVSSGMVTCRE